MYIFVGFEYDLYTVLMLYDYFNEFLMFHLHSHSSLLVDILHSNSAYLHKYINYDNIKSLKHVFLLLIFFMNKLLLSVIICLDHWFSYVF